MQQSVRIAREGLKGMAEGGVMGAIGAITNTFGFITFVR